MNTDEGSLDGLARCCQAFKRLVDGLPVVAAHVGLAPSKVTAGIVSVEAGFDRGYLKKARKSHQELIAQIDAFRKSSKPSETNAVKHQDEMLRADSKVEQLKAELAVAIAQRDQVLAQNIQLYERLLELETLLLQSRSG